MVHKIANPFFNNSFSTMLQKFFKVFQLPSCQRFFTFDVSYSKNIKSVSRILYAFLAANGGGFGIFSFSDIQSEPLLP